MRNRSRVSVFYSINNCKSNLLVCDNILERYGVQTVAENGGDLNICNSP